MKYTVQKAHKNAHLVWIKRTHCPFGLLQFTKLQFTITFGQREASTNERQPTSVLSLSLSLSDLSPQQIAENRARKSSLFVALAVAV